MTSKCGEFFKTRKPLKIAGIVLGGIIVAALMAFLLGWVVMLLWNWLMPTIFGLGTITYWQGFGIFFLAKLLFGFGGDHSSNKKKKSKKGTIRGTIGKEIKTEIKKEFKKEFDKEFDKERNEDYDDKYEDWWENEGKAAFDGYMNDKTESEPAEDTEQV